MAADPGSIPFEAHEPAPQSSRYAQSVVAVVVFDQDHPERANVCSGALVEPNLVLTARHCVSKGRTTAPSCDAWGNSHNGEHLAEDFDPERIAIYEGDKVDLAKDEPHARGSRLLHPEGRVLCDADIAYVVLDRPLLDTPTLPISAERPLEAGTRLAGIGFGGREPNDAAVHRVVRPSGEVLGVGPSTDRDSGKVLGPRELEVAGGTCVGDSGGPAVDLTKGEIVGVTSRGSGCAAVGNHVYTRVGAFEPLTLEARVAARGVGPGHPDEVLAQGAPRRHD